MEKPLAFHWFGPPGPCTTSAETVGCALQPKTLPPKVAVKWNVLALGVVTTKVAEPVVLKVESVHEPVQVPLIRSGVKAGGGAGGGGGGGGVAAEVEGEEEAGRRRLLRERRHEPLRGYSS